MNHFTLIDEAFPQPPAMDVAVSHSVLGAVSRGELGGILRLHVPGPVVAFGRSDRAAPRYPDAVRAAQAHGFGAVERLAGGRAAVFHEQTLAFSWAVPDPEPRKRTTERFEIASSLIANALSTLGVDARVGELPGEYCPGKYSVNLAGKTKVMGVGQRVVRGAAHVGGVVVVDDSLRIRDVLIPVYRSLDLDWDPRTTGAVADRAPGVAVEDVSNAVISSFSTRFDLTPGTLSEQVVSEATSLVSGHLPEVA